MKHSQLRLKSQRTRFCCNLFDYFCAHVLKLILLITSMSYGYDSFRFEDDSFDESFYLESIKPLTNVENFDNMIDALVQDKSYTENTESNIFLKNKYIETLNSTKYLSSSCDKYKKIIKYKYDENYYLKNQLYIFYVLLFISILVIMSQKITCNNLKQIIYILKLNSKSLDPNAPAKMA